MAYEASGKLEVIYDIHQVTEKFKKREFVIETSNGNYPEHIKMQLVQDKCDLLDGMQVGDTVKVNFDLRGKPYQKQGETIYFTNIQAWKIDKVESSDQSAPPAAKADDVSGVTFTEEESNDLPF